LRAIGIQPVFAREFGDHHRYTAQELLQLAEQASSQGASALVTTEKDLINLPHNALELLAGAGQGMQLYWLKIATVVQEKDELMKMVQAVLV
ncbi:MAG: tetraacyldisaccharide 4'-kinase, partial [Acidobacteriota bacterium]|nr:tetraacyldisaccharide 4'-kinase [Acidobacteriota bacterium]